MSSIHVGHTYLRELKLCYDLLEFVAPRLRKTDLPCIASPETMSSGNTQHLGTENNHFIDTTGSKFILQQVSRLSGTPGAAEQ